MEQSELTKEQLKAKEEMLERAAAFQLLTTSPGFAYLKAYYENKIKAFVNDLFNQEGKSITDFEGDRREIIGMKKMFGEIDWALLELEKERKNAKPTE